MIKGIPYYIIILSAFIFSCTPQRRIARIISRHPDAIIYDTTKLTSTLITPALSIPFKFSVDTIISLRPGDTITTGENKVVLTISTDNDSVNINVNILPDTIRKDTSIVRPSITVTHETGRKFTRLDWILLILSMLTVIALLRFLFPGKK